MNISNEKLYLSVSPLSEVNALGSDFEGNVFPVKEEPSLDFELGEDFGVGYM